MAISTPGLNLPFKLFSVLLLFRTFSFIRNAVEFVPMVIWTLFVGSFLDKAQNSTKWLLLLHILAEMVQLIMFALNEYYFELSELFAFFTGR